MDSLTGSGKEFAFYSKCDGGQCRVLSRGVNLIWFFILFCFVLFLISV